MSISKERVDEIRRHLAQVHQVEPNQIWLRRVWRDAKQRIRTMHTIVGPKRGK